MVKKDAAYRSGYVALIGPPNVGKSTLLNRLLGQKISIVSPKPQTTRERILGILHRPGAEIIFVDTPGLHLAKGRLNQQMVRAARAAIDDADVVVVVLDVSPPRAERPPAPWMQALLAELADKQAPTVIALNKIDTIAKPKLLPLIEAVSRLHKAAEIIPLSAREGDGLEHLLGACAKHIPEGPRLFDEEQVTDVSERKLASELVREQIFLQLEEELPYASAVVTERFEEKTNAKGEPMTAIDATIYVARGSQKAIVIGKGGARLREIGTKARRQIERLLGGRVHLSLHVKELADWTEREPILRELGYQEQSAPVSQPKEE